MDMLNPNIFFTSLSNDTRLRCLMLLFGYGELCVCELTYALAISQPHVSRHLALLRENGLVSDKRAGQWVYYQINPHLPAWMMGVLRNAFESLIVQLPYMNDARLLKEMPHRPDSPRCA